MVGDLDHQRSRKNASPHVQSTADAGLQAGLGSANAGCRALPERRLPLLAASLGIGLVMLLLLVVFGRRRWLGCVRHRREEQQAKAELNIRASHDTLLQEVQGLVLRFEAVAKHVPAADPLRVMMDTVLERADRVVLDGHDRIRHLQDMHDADLELSSALALLAEELSSDGAASFRIVVEGVERRLSGGSRESIYLIAQDAIANAFRHADASHIEVEINHGAEWLRLRVRDDGVGIDSQIVEDQAIPGHRGLTVMRERTLQLGAELAIWGRDGLGTEVELQVPAAIAYETSRKSLKSKLRRLIGDGRQK